MKNVMDRSLLDVIANELGCEYLSDLRLMKGFLRVRAVRFIEDTLPADVSLNEWNDALDYLVSAPAEKTQVEARQRLLESLRQSTDET